jgi:electron transfer flavoprotein alpha/beta subunit
MRAFLTVPVVVTVNLRMNTPRPPLQPAKSSYNEGTEWAFSSGSGSELALG